MSKSDSKRGSGTRKHGRSARKPSHLRYNAERRWETNKARKAAKLAKKLARLASKRKLRID